jgi:hypothetical protein
MRRPEGRENSERSQSLSSIASSRQSRFLRSSGPLPRDVCAGCAASQSVLFVGGFQGLSAVLERHWGMRQGAAVNGGPRSRPRTLSERVIVWCLRLHGRQHRRVNHDCGALPCRFARRSGNPRAPHGLTSCSQVVRKHAIRPCALMRVRWRSVAFVIRPSRSTRGSANRWHPRNRVGSGGCRVCGDHRRRALAY